MTIDWTTTLMSFLGLVTGSGALVRVLFMDREKKPVPLATVTQKGKLVKIMYVLGDMRGRSHAECVDAIGRAEQQYVNLLRLGIYPIAVGVNTTYDKRDFVHPAMFEEAGKEVIARCDGVLLLSGYAESPEAKAVYEYAKALEKPMFEQSEGHLREKLQTWATSDA